MKRLELLRAMNMECWTLLLAATVMYPQQIDLTARLHHSESKSFLTHQSNGSGLYHKLGKETDEAVEHQQTSVSKSSQPRNPSTPQNKPKLPKTIMCWPDSNVRFAQPNMQISHAWSFFWLSLYIYNTVNIFIYNYIYIYIYIFEMSHFRPVPCSGAWQSNRLALLGMHSSVPNSCLRVFRLSEGSFVWYCQNF